MKVRPHFAMQNVQKNSLKLRNIAYLQALTPGRVKKITLKFYIDVNFLTLRPPVSECIHPIVCPAPVIIIQPRVQQQLSPHTAEQIRENKTASSCPELSPLVPCAGGRHCADNPWYQ